MKKKKEIVIDGDDFLKGFEEFVIEMEVNKLKDKEEDKKDLEK